MKISSAKTEVPHLSRHPGQCVLQVNGATLKQVEKFKYLGVAFTSDGRQDEELDTRVGKGSAVIRALHCYSKLACFGFKQKTFRLARFQPLCIRTEQPFET